ncbi:MAG: Ycf66 family protein [Cyanobacteria bacterium J06635_11]
MSFTPVTLLVGIVLILGALALFFLDKLRPGYARDTDKVYAVLLLISGFLSLGHLTAGVTESFQLMLMAGMLFTLVLENVRNREPVVEPPMRMDPRPPRPPRPRYDDRPQNRRVYRAELDERNDPRRAGAFPGENRGYPPRMNPAQDPRMASVRDDYRRGEYAPTDRPRQPYEEYRGPAGRLQPSPNGPNEGFNNRPPERYADNNGRYGERPPASRGPMQRPPSEPPQNGTRGDETFAQRRPSGGEDRFDSRPGNRENSNGMNDRSGERPPNTERALNVRPYSEAPKIDLSREGNPESGYRGVNQPEGSPSDV